MYVIICATCVIIFWVISCLWMVTRCQLMKDYDHIAMDNSFRYHHTRTLIRYIKRPYNWLTRDPSGFRDNFIRGQIIKWQHDKNHMCLFFRAIGNFKNIIRTLNRSCEWSLILINFPQKFNHLARFLRTTIKLCTWQMCIIFKVGLSLSALMQNSSSILKWIEYPNWENRTSALGKMYRLVY